MDQYGFAFHPIHGILSRHEIDKCDIKEKKLLKQILEQNKSRNTQEIKKMLKTSKNKVFEENEEHETCPELETIFSSEIKNSQLGPQALIRINNILDERKNKKEPKKNSFYLQICNLLMTFDPVPTRAGMDYYIEVLFKMISCDSISNLNKVLILIKCFNFKWYVKPELWPPSQFEKILNNLSVLAQKTTKDLLNQQSKSTVSFSAAKICKNVIEKHFFAVSSYFRPRPKNNILDTECKNSSLLNYTHTIEILKKLCEFGIVDDVKVKQKLKGNITFNCSDIYNEVFNDQNIVAESTKDHYSNIQLKKKKNSTKGIQNKIPHISKETSSSTSNCSSSIHEDPLLSDLQSSSSPTRKGKDTNSFEKSSLLETLKKKEVVISKETPTEDKKKVKETMHQNKSLKEKTKSKDLNTCKPDQLESKKGKNLETELILKSKHSASTNSEEAKISQASSNKNNESLNSSKVIHEGNSKNRAPKSAWMRKAYEDTQNLLTISFTHGIEFAIVGSFKIGTQISGTTQNINFVCYGEKAGNMPAVIGQLKSKALTMKEFSKFSLQTLRQNQEVIIFQHNQNYKNSLKTIQIEIKSDLNHKTRDFYEYINNCFLIQRKIRSVFEELVRSLITYNYYSYAKLNSYFILILIIKACQLKKLLPTIETERISKIQTGFDKCDAKKLKTANC